MTKMIFLGLAAVFTFNAQAQLYFGATSAKAAKNENCYYKFSVPQVAPGPNSGPQAAKIANALNAKWKADLATGIADFENSVLDPELCKDWSTAVQYWSSFRLESALDATIASIVFTNSGYTGGAHGYSADSSFIFNTKTGQQYKNLGEFFADSKLPALKAKILEYIKYNHEDFDQTFGFDNWSKETDSMYKISNFYFTEYGMTVYYNPYEVGSYAEGLIKADLPYSELKTIGFLPNGPAKELPLSTKSPGQ